MADDTAPCTCVSCEANRPGEPAPVSEPYRSPEAPEVVMPRHPGFPEGSANAETARAMRPRGG